MDTIIPEVQSWRLHQQWLKTKVEKEARPQPDVLLRGRAVMACRRLQEVRAATWNVSSVVRRSGEVVNALHRRKTYFYCAQETRWKCGSAKMFSAIVRR